MLDQRGVISDFGVESSASESQTESRSVRLSYKPSLDSETEDLGDLIMHTLVDCLIIDSINEFFSEDSKTEFPASHTVHPKNDLPTSLQSTLAEMLLLALVDETSHIIHNPRL